MAFFTHLKAWITAFFLSISIPGLALANTASTAVTGAMTAAVADIGTYGLALVGVAVAGVVFMIAIKFIKRIRGAA